MKRLLMPLMILALAPVAVRAACTDQMAVVNARTAADRACAQMGMGCGTAKTHGQYVSCVAHQAKANTTLPKECRGAVIKCAARSTCGKTGFVTCCRTNAHSVQKCGIKRSAAACKAPKRGRACVGDQPSCCDACGGATCPLVTPTTTPTSTTLRRTTTTTMPHATTTTTPSSATTTTTPACIPPGGGCTVNRQCCSQVCYLGQCY